MVAITSIRTCNLTPHARRQIITSMIPLRAGQVSGSGRKVWTARDAIRDGELRGDAAVQATKEGPDYPDGSWRMARVHFPAELDAATTGYQTYPLWKEHEFEIDTAAGSIPAHSLDATTELGLSGLTFTLRTRGRPLERDSGNRPIRGSQATIEHVVTFTPEAGTIPDYTAPYTVSNPAKSEFADTAGTGNTWIRAYRVSGRVLPEANGGSNTEPSFAGTLFYEVASEGSGVGRFVRFWFEAANSLCTTDAAPRDENTVEYELQQDVTLEVRCSTTAMRVVIDTTAGYQQRPPRAIANGWSVPTYEHDQSPGRNDWVFPHLMGSMIRGYIVFPGSMTATERSTRDAIYYQNGDHAFAEGVATNWAETECWGAFGVVHKPEDVFQTSLSNWRAMVAREHLNQLGRARDPRRGLQWNFFPSYTQTPATGSGSVTPAMGASVLGQFAGTAHPDLRAVYISAKQDVQRPMCGRNNDCDVFDSSEETTRPGGLAAGVDSPVMMYDGQPWWLDFGQERYGKGAALAAQGSIPKALDRGSGGSVTAYETSTLSSAARSSMRS